MPNMWMVPWVVSTALYFNKKRKLIKLLTLSIVQINVIRLLMIHELENTPSTLGNMPRPGKLADNSILQKRHRYYGYFLNMDYFSHT